MKMWEPGFQPEPVEAIHSALVFLVANIVLTLSISGWLCWRFPGWLAAVGCGAALWVARHSGVVRGRIR